MPKAPRPAPRDLVDGPWPFGTPTVEGTGVEHLQRFVQRIRRATEGMPMRAIADRVGVLPHTIRNVLFNGTVWPDWYTTCRLEAAFGATTPNVTTVDVPGIGEVTSSFSDDPAVLAAAHTNPNRLLDALADSLGDQCERAYPCPVDGIYLRRGRSPFDPAAELRIDLYDRARHLVVRYAKVFPNYQVPESMRFGDIYGELSILDAIAMQFGESPPAQALLLPLLPPSFWQTLILRRNVNIIYPKRPNDLTEFEDIFRQIFVAASPDAQAIA